MCGYLTIQNQTYTMNTNLISGTWRVQGTNASWTHGQTYDKAPSIKAVIGG